MLALAGVGILLAYGMNKAVTHLSGVDDLGRSLKEDAARTQEQMARLAETSPQTLALLPNAQVIAAGLAKPISPWAWQELERRPLTAAEAGQIITGVTAWLQRTHPAGGGEPLNWLDNFLEHLDATALLTEAQKVSFLTALHGDLRLSQPLARLRAGADRLQVEAQCRWIWREDFLGYELMNAPLTATVDGQPVRTAYDNNYYWNMQDLNAAYVLPALAPGQHTFKLSVMSALVAKDDLAGLANNVPPAEWPPAKKRWTRTAEMTLIVYPRDAVIVSQTQDPALDPQANGSLSVRSVIVRAKGARAQAAVALNFTDKLPVPVSFAVTLRAGGQTVACGKTYYVKTTNGSISGGEELTAELAPLAADITEADVILTPDAGPVEGIAVVDRIWGKPITFAHVPLKRQDLASGGNNASQKLTEPPTLQFLAWRDEWETNHADAVRHPDGTPVTDTAERAWLKGIPIGGQITGDWRQVPAPRFLKLWFSHPALDGSCLNDITMFDEAGQSVPFGAGGNAWCGEVDANEHNGHLGWQVKTFSPDTGTNHPARLTFRLRYTLGPLEHTQEVVPALNTSQGMTLEGNGQINGVGQDIDGRAFVSLAYAPAKMSNRRFGVVTVAKDGRQIIGSSSWSDTGVRTETFTFDLPLADVAKFIIGTRPVRTNEWKDVVLPGNAASAFAAFGPVIERVVSSDAGRTLTGIDLDSGNVATFTYDPDNGTNVLGTNTVSAAQFFAARGVDAMGINSPLGLNHCGLSCINATFAITADTADWDHMSAAELLAHTANLPTGRAPFKNSPDLQKMTTLLWSEAGTVPQTYLFRTGDQGTSGLLQITGFTENPRGVKVRYKLVPTGGAQK